MARNVRLRMNRNVGRREPRGKGTLPAPAEGWPGTWLAKGMQAATERGCCCGRGVAFPDGLLRVRARAFPYADERTHRSLSEDLYASLRPQRPRVGGLS